MEMNVLYEVFLKNRVVSTDSRNITPGCIFFALKGENFNGNKFAKDALDKGAALAVVDEDPGLSAPGIIRVNNVLDTLQHLAEHHRKQSGIPVLAITGSNGKTTTKELCKAVLSVKFNVHATEGNLNNHIGVPLTLLSMKPGCEFAIVEMGANHHGEIDTLCRIARPDYGLVTNIGKAHLEGFGGIEGVARAKGELIRHLMANSKTIFLNEGNKWLANQVTAGYPHVVRYNTPSGLHATEIISDPYLSLNVKNGTDTLIITKLAGAYNAENVLAACAVGLFFGISDDRIKEAIAAYEPKNNRSQIIKTSRNTVFMDAYNANPSSMSAAIEEFINNTKSNKMLILGEMREVGEASEAEHAEIARRIKNSGISNVFFVGKAFEKPASELGYPFASSVEDLNELLIKSPPDGFYIMLKGSRSNRLEKSIQYL